MGRPVILEKYPYTYLRTIIMKKNLLKRADYDKILKMGAEEIGKYLEEFEYKKEIDELAIEYQGIELIEKTLQLNLGNTFLKLLKISPADLKLLINLYIKRYEIENIKTIMRGKFCNFDVEQTKKSMNLLSLQGQSLFDRLLTQKNIEDQINLLSFIDEKDKRLAQDHFKEHNNLTIAENVLDKYYLTYVKSQLRYLSQEGKLYKKSLLCEIDVQNIKLLLQLKTQKINEQVIKDLIVSHGNLKKEVIDKLIKLDAERILKELENTFFKEIAEKYSKEKPEDIDFMKLEVDLDRFLLEQSRKLIRQHPMTVDVILGYMFLKDLEVKNLTRIIKSKQLKLDEKFIDQTIVI